MIYMVFPRKQLRMRNHPENSQKQYGQRKYSRDPSTCTHPGFARGSCGAQDGKPEGFRQKKSSCIAETKLTHYLTARTGRNSFLIFFAGFAYLCGRLLFG
jgi:hypothetical protein